jgi:type VI protein secretion system component Hcp
MPGESADSIQASHPLLRLQRTIGNRAVQRLLAQRLLTRDAALQRSPDKNATAAPPRGFFKITFERAGELKGSGKHPGFEGIPIESISVGPPPRAKRSDENEPDKSISLTITRFADDNSSALMKAMADGDMIKAGKLVLVTAGDDGQLTEYFSVEVAGGLITSFHMGKGDPPVEVISIEFASGEMAVPPAKEPSKPGKPAEYGWKVEEGER